MRLHRSDISMRLEKLVQHGISAPSRILARQNSAWTQNSESEEAFSFLLGQQTGTSPSFSEDWEKLSHSFLRFCDRSQLRKAESILSGRHEAGPARDPRIALDILYQNAARYSDFKRTLQNGPRRLSHSPVPEGDEGRTGPGLLPFSVKLPLESSTSGLTPKGTPANLPPCEFSPSAQRPHPCS